VRGAHAGDYNTDTVGISMIGDYDTAPLTRRLKRAMVRLIGWRLGTSYTRIRGTTRLLGLRVPRILAHRDVMSTACPGRYGIAFLPALRSRVRAYLSDYDSPIRERAAEIGRDVTGPVFIGELQVRGGLLTRFESGRMMMRRGGTPHWLAGRPLHAYLRHGGLRGHLGFPTSGLAATNVPRLRRMRFEHGALYQYRKAPSRILYGRVLLRWGKLGGPDGSLGVPRTSVRSRPQVETAWFESGRITWYRATDEVVVKTA
jgi:hypothetical protein